MIWSNRELILCLSLPLSLSLGRDPGTVGDRGTVVDTFPPFLFQVGFMGGPGVRLLALLLPRRGGSRARGAMVDKLAYSLSD